MILDSESDRQLLLRILDSLTVKGRADRDAIADLEHRIEGAAVAAQPAPSTVEPQ